MRTRRRALALAAAALAAAALAGCGSSDDVDGLARPGVLAREQRIRHGGRPARAGPRRARRRPLRHPAPGEANRLFIVQQSGRILIQQNGRLLGAPFLDIASSISSGGEQGLLGLAFHPQYASNGRFYVNYTNRVGRHPGGGVHPRERRTAPTRPARGRCWRSTSRSRTTTAGTSPSGPTAKLYVATGDGGSGGDPNGNGQNTDTLLGKLLRIDVDARTGGLPYGIPADNPFAVGRRPSRDLLLRAAQPVALLLRPHARRPLDRRRRPGRHRGDRLPGQGPRPRRQLRLERVRGPLARSRAPAPCAARRPCRPVAQYTHASGCSVTGGYVYRGQARPGSDRPLRLRRLLQRAACGACARARSPAACARRPGGSA